MKIVCIGSGNLATNLTRAWKTVGQPIAQVFSRSAEHAQLLAKQLDCPWTTSAETIITDADLYLFALKDSALQEVATRMHPNQGLWVHTAGSLPMNVLQPFSDRHGVFYPLQTFSKNRLAAWRTIPIFLETSHKEDGALLETLARQLSDDVRFLSSEQRKHIHLAAVFACNFVNHLYAIAGNLLTEAHVPFETLLPLIDETAAKVHRLTPKEAQTGPAIRYDENIIHKHLTLLNEHPEWQTLYERLSQDIHQKAHQ